MASRRSSRGPSPPPSTRPALLTMSSDPVSPEFPDQTASAGGMGSQEMGNNRAVTHAGAFTNRNLLIDRRHFQEGELSAHLPASTEYAEPASCLQAYNKVVSPASVIAPSQDRFASPIFGVTMTGLGARMQLYYNNAGLFPTYGLTVRHGPWGSTAPEREDNLPGNEIVPSNHRVHFSTTAAPTCAQDLYNEIPFDVGLPSQRGLSGGRATAPTNLIPQYGVPESDIFDFDREFGVNNVFADANRVLHQELPSDPALPATGFFHTGPTYLPTEEQLSGERDLTPSAPLGGQEQLQHEFQVALVRKLTLPSMEALNRAADECKQKNFYNFGIGRKTSTFHRPPFTSADVDYDYATPPSKSSPMPPRKKIKLQQTFASANLPPAQAPVFPQPAQASVIVQPAQAAVVSQPVNGDLKSKWSPVGEYLFEKPASDLIRDARKPNPDDYSQGALVYRVATSTTGRQTNFTFRHHYNVIINCLRDELVAELNRKLRVDLSVQNLHLIRDLPTLFPGQRIGVALRRRIEFAQKAFQRRIDWMGCPEHYDLMASLNFSKPNLDLVELDRLVKATGVWVFENWQADHPGQQHGSS
ncbi:hypothetical protein DPSP01_013687 [Paraphaeosphaeria sporulosa]